MDWKELKKERWIVAVSGGPDSMALLAMAYHNGLDIAAAHVNYHKRDTAERDEKTVTEYCQKYGIPCQILKPIQEKKGNFQAWAREVRYQFFKEMADSFKAAGVLVAHQMEDVLETWKMQQDRSSISEWHGIRSDAVLYGVRVVRPLLNKSKKELIAYCEANEVPYHHDESNFEDHYQRNVVRHHWLEKMTKKEQEEIVQLIQKENETAVQEIKQLELWTEEKKIALSFYLDLPQRSRILFLDAWLTKNKAENYSRSSLKDWDRQLNNPGNTEIQISQQLKLVKMYDWLEIIPINDVSYCYVLDKIELFTTPWFSLSTEGRGVEAVTLNESDWPLTLRSPRAGDSIELRFGTKKLNRWFIDRKIPWSQRECWPVLLNRQGKVILIPGIGSDIEHYSNNPTLYVVK